MKFPIKQSYTVAAASLTGFASNVTGAAFALTVNTPGDGLAHHVTIKNDAATDHSGKTVTLVGFDATNKELTEVVTGPAGSATVTSTKAFSYLTSATPSATIGTDTFDLGWAATAVSPWVSLDYHEKSFSASVAVTKGGTINYDVEHTYDTALEDGAVAFKHADITGSTANDSGVYLAPVTAVRVNVNSHTAGTFVLHVLQGER